MKKLKRAIQSLKGQIVKSTILLVVVFIVSNVIFSSLIIQNTSLSLSKSIKLGLGAKAKVDYTAGARTDEGTHIVVDKIPDLNKNLVHVYSEISKVKGVDDFSYVIKRTMSGSIHPTYSTEDKSLIRSNDSSESTNMNLFGVSSPNLLEEGFEERRLTRGRFLTKDEIESKSPVAVISEYSDLKKANGEPLGLNDKVQLEFLLEFTERNVGSIGATNELSETVEVEIVGFYDVPVISKGGPEVLIPSLLFGDMTNNYNEKMGGCFKTCNFGQNEYFNSRYPEIVNVQNLVFIDSVDSIAFVQKTIEDLIEKYQDEYQEFSVYSSADEYQRIAGPIDNLLKTSNIIVVGSIVATLLILILIINLILKDRRKELGIFLAMGESIPNIFGQVLIEFALISLLALSLSIFSSQILATSISNKMIAVQEQYIEGLDDEDNEKDRKKLLHTYQTNVARQDKALIFVLTYGVIIGSSLLPIYSLRKVSPKKILM